MIMVSFRNSLMHHMLRLDKKRKRLCKNKLWSTLSLVRLFIKIVNKGLHGIGRSA